MKKKVLLKVNEKQTLLKVYVREAMAALICLQLQQLLNKITIVKEHDSQFQNTW